MQTDKCVVALGFFDGVHIGHAALLSKAVQRARELDAEPAVLGFDTHPDTIVFGREVPLINSMADRQSLIRRLFGIEKSFVLHFDAETMRLPWRNFIERLIEHSSAVHFVVGHDFRFGYRGEGTAEKLVELGKTLGFSCDVIPPVSLDGTVVSSTEIRKQLLEGDLERANSFLGHTHTLTDIVRVGFRLGRTLGSPTVNMRFEEGVLVPRHGVYATRLFFDGQEHIAVTNIGVRPTVSDGGSAVSVESYILDFSGDLYGREIRLEFCGFIRPEKKFYSVDELKAQIQRDADTARSFFSNK